MFAVRCVLSICPSDISGFMNRWYIPYSAKFSRGLIFADFVGSNPTRKLSPRKLFFN